MLAKVSAIIVLITATIVTFSFEPINNGFYLVVALSATVIGNHLWILFQTNYTLTDEKIIYKSGALRGEIKVKEITEIEVGKSVSASIKPALAQKGLTIKCEKNKTVYISPETPAKLVNEVPKHNEEICVV